MWDDLFDFGYDDPDFSLLAEQPMPEFETSLTLDDWTPDMIPDFSTIEQQPTPTFPQGLKLDPSIINGGNGVDMLGSIAKMFGLTDKNGNINSNALLSLLTSLGMAGGVLNQNSATRDATAQLQEAARAANARAEELIGGARANYQPYMQAGTQALSGLQGMVGNSNLSGKYGSLPAVSPVIGRTLSQLSIPQR